VPQSRIRQPRVAEIVASRLRDDILSGRLKEGDILPSQESLFGEFGVSPPALREAIHLLETDGLVSVRRGNVGGAVVHLPSAERTAHMISMVLQARASTPADVSGALMHLAPICAGMCAAREDRLVEVVPYLEAEIAAQTEQFDDATQFVPNARRFHEVLVSRCGNEPMILLIGSLELIWSAHDRRYGATTARLEAQANKPGGLRSAIINDYFRPSGMAMRCGPCASPKTTSRRLGPPPWQTVQTRRSRPSSSPTPIRSSVSTTGRTPDDDRLGHHRRPRSLRG
jgi:GntR family transcriptional repressor for pyruvate dehydrogenase complex